MAGITQATAQTMLETWLEAEAAVSTGQSYSIANRQLTRANLKEIGERIAYWDAKVQSLDAGRTGPRITGATQI